MLFYFRPMIWKRLLAHITGSVDQDLLLRNEYLATENYILKSHLKGRLGLTDPERVSLAEIGKRLGRKALGEVAQLVRPETILRWHRMLIARKFDGSKKRSSVSHSRRRIDELVIRFARENQGWGYRRIVGALSNLGYKISHQTVANILRRHGLSPAPERQTKTTWRDFIRTHMEVLAAVDFFTAEIWTAGGLMTYYVLTFMRVATRQVCIAGITTSPDRAWMEQMARNLTMADTGFLGGCRYVLHDRDGKFCAAFDGILESVGIKAVTLPPRSPNLNAHCERWIRSVKTEVLSKMILFGEGSLRHCLENYLSHRHAERNHQGKENLLLFPAPADRLGESTGAIFTRERLGGLLKFYHRQAE